MNAKDLDELLLHAKTRGEAVLFTPAKLVPTRGEHRRPTWELVSWSEEARTYRVRVADDLDCAPVAGRA